MTGGPERPLNQYICEDIPIVYQAVRETPCFDAMNMTAQIATVEFVSAGLKFFGEQTEQNRQNLKSAFAEVVNSVGSRTIAVEAFVRALSLQLTNVTKRSTV